jgi:uncharacterized membrane protein
MTTLLIVGIIIAGLIVIHWLHHWTAYLLKLNPQWTEEIKEKTNAIETVGWWGPFYINKNDKRLFLPKRWGWGVTINLGRPAGFVITAAIIGFAIWAIVAGS